MAHPVHQRVHQRQKLALGGRQPVHDVGRRRIVRIQIRSRVSHFQERLRQTIEILDLRRLPGRGQTQLWVTMQQSDMGLLQRLMGLTRPLCPLASLRIARIERLHLQRVANHLHAQHSLPTRQIDPPGILLGRRQRILNQPLTEDQTAGHDKQRRSV